MTYINRLDKAIKFDGATIAPETQNMSMKPRQGFMFIVPTGIWNRSRRPDLVTPDPKTTITSGGVMECSVLLTHQ